MPVTAKVRRPFATRSGLAMAYVIGGHGGRPFTATKVIGVIAENAVVGRARSKSRWWKPLERAGSRVLPTKPCGPRPPRIQTSPNAKIGAGVLPRFASRVVMRTKGSPGRTSYTVSGKTSATAPFSGTSGSKKLSRSIVLMPRSLHTTTRAAPPSSARSVRTRS